LVPTLIALNDLERRNSPYLAFFSPKSIDFQADYITVVEDRPTMSVKYIFSQFHSSTFGQNYNAPAARSLCDSWASCWKSFLKLCKPAWWNKIAPHIHI